jgi:hypothetical protein
MLAFFESNNPGILVSVIINCKINAAFPDLRVELPDFVTELIFADHD